MDNEEKTEIEVQETPQEEIEATFEGEIVENPNPKKDKKGFRNLIIIASLFGALIALTTAVLVIGNNIPATVTYPRASWSTTSPGLYGEERTSLGTLNVSLEKNDDGYYSLSSITGNASAKYLVLPTSYDNTNIVYTKALASDTNLFGNDGSEDSIEEIYFPKIYYNVGSYSFANMEGLTKVSFASGTSTSYLNISAGAFASCPNLTTIEFPANLKTVEIGAFDSPNLSTIYYKGTMSNFEPFLSAFTSFSETLTVECSDGSIQVQK